ncbi:hypothetical protein F4818DRAFT_440251 [Hypoxylon cercidicola]|nr:hypothetical protein F4818DRAFT_440251 [Hypoxylon cercidicola]
MTAKLSPSSSDWKKTRQGELPSRTALLATLFFLRYLEGRIELTHANLKKAFDAYQLSDKTQLGAVEVRLLMWIRLIDARATGGQGLFLSEIDEKLLASLASIVLFRKVQSFMGRIAHQDPWHRRRGTVEDEAEVMGIAAGISKDVRQLYETARPPLMDYAAAGLLVAPHISPTLALIPNHEGHASKIHLHRVAYKSLPLRLLVDGDAQDMQPVNMLWPSAMWGSEEENPEEREWIKSQILCMEKVATHARITSQVLEEVPKCQE